MSTSSRPSITQDNPKPKNYFQFNKLNEPNDTLFDKAYKRFFRYSSPNLIIFGPFAPAHDALLPRVTMAAIQISIGAFLFSGTFRRFPSTISKSRRIATRMACFIGGGALIATGNREVVQFLNPNSNPLFIEISIARTRQESQGKGRGSYWSGPDNFMPMNTLTYTKMLGVMKLHSVMVDEYNESDITKRYIALASKFRDDYDKKNEETKFIDRINAIVDSKNNNELQIHARTDAKSWFLPNDVSPNLPPSTKGEMFQEWTNHHPWNQLNDANMNYFLSYEFPSLLAEDNISATKKEEDREEGLK